MERILGGLPMTQPLSDIPPVEEPILGGDVRSIFRPDETKLDKAKGLADAGLSLFGALVHGVPAQFMGKMGPEFQAKRFRPPQTPAGERYFDVAAEALGKVAEAFPMQPTAFTSPANILAGPAVAQAGAKAADVNAMAQKALQAAGGRLEKAVEKQVFSTMEKGGLPAEILQGMTQGTQSFMVPQRVEAPRNEMKLYSPAEEAALNLQRGQGRGEGFLNDLRKAGVRDEELEYTGLKDFLAGKQNVSKKEIQDYLAENKVQLGEVQLGTGVPDEYKKEYDRITDLRDRGGQISHDEWRRRISALNNRYGLDSQAGPSSVNKTRHSQWTLPGGENYREILLTLPTKGATEAEARAIVGENVWGQMSAEQRAEFLKHPTDANKKAQYRSSHWDQPNVLAHLRVNDRVDADGKKMLLIEEIQSDWHQAGREKGYASKSGQLPAGWEVVEVPKYGYRGGPQIGTEFMVFDRSKTQVGFASPTREGAIANATGSSSLGVPDAPFKEDWYQLVLKRALQEAVDKGYDRVGITTGKRQIDRYTDALRANVDAIEYEPFKTDAGEIRYEVVGVKNGKPVVELDDLSYKDLQEKVGKEIAEKIRANAGESLAADRPMRPDWMRLSTDNLSIGGEGMKKYYDEIYPGFLNKYGKKFDAKVGETRINPIERISGGQVPMSAVDEPVRYIDITPKMKEALSKGQPMFKEGGLVSNTDTIKARLIEQGMPEDKAFMQALKLANEVQMAKGGLAGLKNLPAAAKAAKKEKSLPIDIPRATPKTKQEIQEEAERVGRQMIGEHVTKPGETANLAGYSKKESERLKAFKEGEDYALRAVRRYQEPQAITPPSGSMLIGLPGDISISDQILKRIGDLDVNAKQEGGPRYGLGSLKDEEALRKFWASNYGPANIFQRKVTELGDLSSDSDVLGAYMSMGRTGMNFAQHFADANLKAIRSAIQQGKVSPEGIEAFNKTIREGFAKKDPKTGEKVRFTFEDFPGIEKTGESYAAMMQDPEMRKFFNDRMKTQKITQPLGLPSGVDIEWAISEPALRNMELGLVGHTVGKMSPGAELISPISHATYSHGIPGAVVGKLPNQVPVRLAFPDASQFIAEKYRPADFTGTIQKVFPHQKVDQQWQDEVGEYLGYLKRITGKKKGGKVSGLSALNRK